MERMPSVMNHNFSRVPKAEIQRSSFDRSHGMKTTFNAGELVPIFVDEVLPGDTFNLNMAGFGRMATPIFPIMDNIYLETFFFFVPNRLVWDNWQKFNGEQENPGDSTDYLIPTLANNDTAFAAQSLHDYFGIPTNVANIGTEISALPFRAYNLIWNEWFRDENLQDSVTVHKGDGPDGADSDYTIHKRGKRHDYFTSCLPWPQKGDAVDLPLGLHAPVVSPANFSNISEEPNAITVLDENGTKRKLSTGGSNVLYGSTVATTGSTADEMYADLTQATAATINQLREAFQVQKLYERDARGGTRYTEILQAHFGVTSPDARLQRPEYLGGGHTPVNINPIAQTSSTDGTSPQGNLAAMATLGFKGHGFTKSFTEHGHIIGLACIRADLTYQQGLNRMWSRKTRWDFYWPALAHLGEQAVLNKEIFMQGTVADDDVFGYQERFAEYRYKPSVITGQFRSNYVTSLDAWHLSQDFETLPILGADFIEENPPIDRVIAVSDPDYPQFIFDSYFSLHCTRPMPVYGVPGLIDHF